MRKAPTYLIVEVLPKNKREYEALGIERLRVEAVRRLPDGRYVLPWDQDLKARPNFLDENKTVTMNEKELRKEIEKQEKAAYFDDIEYLKENIDYWENGVLKPKKPKKVKDK